tara:strand:- start:5536 stop:5745 length:210 start_codon:yes stop_codon:yes gene_type:complete
MGGHCFGSDIRSTGTAIMLPAKNADVINESGAILGAVCSWTPPAAIPRAANSNIRYGTTVKTPEKLEPV